MDIPASILSGEGDFRAYMTGYIRRHFAHLLGEHVSLLDQEDGLEKISELLRQGKFGVEL